MANQFLTNYVNAQKKPSQSVGGVIGKITNAFGLGQKPASSPSQPQKLSQNPIGPQRQTITPSNNSATSIKPTTIKPPVKNPVTSSPAAQGYISMLSSQNPTNAVNTTANQVPGIGVSVPNSIGGTTTRIDPNAPTVQAQNTPPTIDPFATYIQSLTKANQRLADIQNEEEQKQLAARRGEQALLDASGGTVAGANQSASVFGRRTNQELADLALQESAAARTAGVAQDAYTNALAINKPIELNGQLVQRQPDGSYKAVAGQAKTPSISDQYGTGSIGEYNFAKSQGYKGSFSDYQNEDANRKARAAGSANGLTASQINTSVNQIAGNFDNEPIVKNFTAIAEANAFVKSLPTNTKNPVDDQGLIYSLAKSLDPGSVVREGEYATAQKYAQSFVKSFGKSVTQAIAGTGFLSEEARKNIKSTIQSRYEASKKNYDNLKSEYQRQINDAYKGVPRQITDYATGTSSTNQTSGVTPSGISYTIIQ